MLNPIITLTTDFGLKDPYVAEMKAVILSIGSDVIIVDISHQVQKFNVRMAAFILASASPYFPSGTVHVAVVDPRVGTKRRAICIEGKHSFYIGPDNGLLALAAKREGMKHVHEITNRKYMLPKPSGTFHGRDIFAPVAANLANGVSPKEFGAEITGIVVPMFARATRKKCTLEGEVIHVDDFGNVITNLAEKEFEKMKTKRVINIRIKNTRLKLNLCRAYGQVKEREPLAIIGSHGFLEISTNRANASKILKVNIGDKITLYHPSKLTC